MDVQANDGKAFLSKTPTILFTTVQIIFGVDFGVAKIVTKKWGCFLKMLCFLFSLNVAVMLMRPFENFSGYYVLYNFSFASEYMSYCLILLLSKYSLYEYLLDFDSINLYGWMKNRNILIGVITRILVIPLMSFGLKGVIFLINRAYSTDEKFSFLPFVVGYFKGFLVDLAFDTTLLVQYIIVYIYYRRLNVLKLKVIKNQIHPANVLRIYKSIMDALDRIKPVLDKLILCGASIAFPRFIATEYMALHQLKQSNDWVSLALQYVVVIQKSCMMSLAAVTAEVANTQADTIKLALLNNQIETTDLQKQSEIKAVLYYMSNRPSQYYVWRRIPLDLRLPISVVSIMTTYLIVIVQLTHLYD